MTTFPTRTTGTTAGRLPRTSGARPASTWAFAGVAVTSFGGPLALAVFALPLAIWLRYARQVNGAGGLYAFVEAAAGRRVALIQAGLWIISYLLYLLYTTVLVTGLVAAGQLAIAAALGCGSAS